MFWLIARATICHPQPSLTTPITCSDACGVTKPPWWPWGVWSFCTIPAIPAIAAIPHRNDTWPNHLAAWPRQLAESRCRQDKLHWSPLKASRWGLVLHNWRQRCDFRILCNILNSRRGQLRPKVFWLTQFVLHRLRLQNSLFDYLWLNNLIDTLMSHLFMGRQWTHMITATWSLLSILWCSLTYWMLTIRRILLNWFSLVDSARLCHLEVLLQEWWRNQSSLAMFGPRLGRNWSTHEYLNQVDFFRDSQMGKGFSL